MPQPPRQLNFQLKKIKHINMNHSLSVSQLAAYLGVTKRTIQRRAVRENWAYEEQTALGGAQRRYYYANLPEHVRNKVIIAIACRAEQNALPAITAEQSGHSVCPGGEMRWQDHIFCSSGDWQTETLTKDEVKNGLVHLAYLFAHDLGKGKIKGFDKFCVRYNQRTLNINIAVYSAVDRISRITLLRWENTCETRYTKIDDTSPAQLQKLTEELIMVNPEITAEHLLMHFKTFFPKLTTPNKKQLNQWLEYKRS